MALGAATMVVTFIGRQKNKMMQDMVNVKESSPKDPSPKEPSSKDSESSGSSDYSTSNTSKQPTISRFTSLRSSRPNKQPSLNATSKSMAQRSTNSNPLRSYIASMRNQRSSPGMKDDNYENLDKKGKSVVGVNATVTEYAMQMKMPDRSDNNPK